MATPLFIIWTFQRTGGTSLAVALERALAPTKCFTKVLHEPFNHDRVFGQIGRDIKQGRDTAARDPLREVLEKGACFKHCFDLHPLALGEMILDVAGEVGGYRHVLLMRRDEVARALSRSLALQTDVWGKARVEQGGYDAFLDGERALKPFPIRRMIQHSRMCLERRAWLESQFRERAIDALSVVYEDLFTGSEDARLAQARKVFDFLDIPFDAESPSIRHAFLANRQGSERLFDRVPNLDDTRRKLARALDQG